jgi:hypothetical protein
VDGYIEVRFYRSRSHPGATQDGLGWYTAINFLPPDLDILPKAPDYEAVVVIKPIVLEAQEICRNVVWREDMKSEVVVQYDGSLLVFTGNNYDELKDVYERFIQGFMPE